MSNPFGKLSQDGLEKTGDVLGGGGTVESGVYSGTIKLAYAGKSAGGAQSLTVHVDIGGREHRETIYVTSKLGNNYYEKDNKKIPLPGFTTANDLALLSTGQALSEQDIEERVVKLYDFDAKAELPTKVQAVVSLHGKEIKLGILKQIVDKNQKNDAGDYVPTGETREENVIDKVFHAETGKTVSEFVNKIAEAEFLPKWEEKNKGNTRNKAKGAAGKTGAPGRAPSAGGSAPAAGSSKSLFG